MISLISALNIAWMFGMSVWRAVCTSLAALFIATKKMLIAKCPVPVRSTVRPVVKAAALVSVIVEIRSQAQSFLSTRR